MGLPAVLLIALALTRGVDTQPSSLAVQDGRVPLGPAARPAAQPSKPRATAPAWAGTYSKSSSWLTLDPSGACTVQYFRGCTRIPVFDCGKVREAEGLLELDGGKGGPKRLIPFVWGERNYLVEPDLMDEFCADVNSGWAASSPHGTHAFLRRDDTKKPVAGLPRLPEPYRALLLEHPIEAQLIEVLPPGWREKNSAGTSIRINAGSAAGVRPGMQMKLVGEQGKATLKVESVNADESVAVVPDRYTKRLPLVVGMRFSSRIYEAP